ncbi:MAG: substrate-binding domain-containing protein, partial [Eubacterium sp.]|nr:substrate-binding domain-containing protein [Eubacterium sp.]
SLGHRRIGTLFSFDESTGQNRYLGCMQALRENGIVQTRDRMVWFEHSRAGDLFEPDGQIGLNRMLADVTAVVCHDDRIAYRLINYLQSKGIRVPEDISVTGYDDSAYATMDLPLTTVKYQGNKYGRNAAKTLLQMIRQPDFDFSGLHADEPELVIRASTTVPRNEKILSVM